MIEKRTYWVSRPGGEEPFRVTLSPEGEAWSIVVERDGESRAFRLADGPEDGRVWVDEGRPASYHWTPSGDGPGRLALDGLVHALEVATEAEHRLAALGIGAAGARRARDVRAPMPGLVLEIEVQEGSAVAEGDGLVIIEAMKMENEITSPIAGVVADLAVSPGEAVEQGALMCRIEPHSEGE
ncbi:MAG: hypothetical protein KY397_01260 [Gemmatimonadetes bacterium]|nr:hypothetical protein [Gemmatimonadota bacterium]